VINLLNEVKVRLSQLGFEITIHDDAMIQFAVDKVSNHIKSETNQKEIPEQLEKVAIDMMVGEFLYFKKSLGLLNVASLDFSTAVKSIQEGDTNVTFAISEKDTTEAKFDKFIHGLIHQEVNYSAFRKLRW